MAADIKTNAYLLGNATLMMAPFGTDPFILTPEDHSIGMVKNVSLSNESDNIELRHGIQQLLVDSKRSNVRTTISAEVYEFNAQNLYYSLSLNQTAVPVKRGKLKTSVTGAQATIVVNTDPIPGDSATGISAVGDIPIGATLLIQRAGLENDYVYPVRVTATTTVSTADYTVTAAIPVGLDFNAGDRVWVVNEVPIASQDEQEFFSLKIAGVLSNNSKPVVLIIPKVKVRRGFQLTFDETAYGNMPFEFDPYFLTSTEATGNLAQIGTRRQGFTYLPQ